MSTIVIDMEATGNNISRLLKENKLNAYKLARLYGFNTPQAIYKWIRGVSLPSLDNLVILSSILHTSIDDIIIVKENTK